MAKWGEAYLFITLRDYYAEGVSVNADTAVVDCECFGTMPNRNVPKRQFGQKVPFWS